MLIHNADQLVDLVKASQVQTGKPTTAVMLLENDYPVMCQVGYDGYMFSIGHEYVEPKDVVGIEILEVQ
jgi:hypothetical protein